MASKAIGKSKAYALLIVFSFAQLLDIVNVSAPVIALPKISQDLNLAASESQWVLNAYTLTFGAFLLTGGRFSAIYGPKALFITGFSILGIGSLLNGFAVNAPMLFVIRALQGIGGAMTIPSAVTMIVLILPNRKEQDRALGLFAGLGAVGNVGGVVMSPKDVYRNMDWLGLFLITVCTLLFVFAVTEGNVKGRHSKEVLPPLIISILLLPVFGYVERKAREPLIPSWIWTLPTFTPLLFYVLSNYAYMNIIMFQMSSVFQKVWQVSAINAAIRMYWDIAFPAFILLGTGNAAAFVFSNVSMLRTPLTKPGIDILETTALVGAIFNSSLQIGSSIGLSIVTAITTQAGHGNSTNFVGYRAGWWYVVGLAAFEAVLAAVCMGGAQISPEQAIAEPKGDLENALNEKL
ncbi:hypothetical protein H0H92_006742 [Tricholoma furcatifolium]|nr:hypothetical protein H0H92_006742 [Tricholoma furcatifolium]